MAYDYISQRFIKRKMGINGQFFMAIKWIKQEDSEIPTYDNQTSLTKV